MSGIEAALQRLRSLREEALEGGGEARIKAQHDRGRIARDPLFFRHRGDRRSAGTEPVVEKPFLAFVGRMPCLPVQAEEVHTRSELFSVPAERVPARMEVPLKQLGDFSSEGVIRSQLHCP